MTVRGFVNEALHAVPLDEVMRHVERICAYDRYQASDGIQAAAAYVAA